MTAKTTLPRHYDLLGVWERVRLRLAASARKDEVEEQRLHDTAPQRPMKLPHHAHAEIALNTLTLMYVSEQLEAACGHFFAMSKFPHDDETLEAASDKDLGLILMLFDLNAYFFHVRSQAWRRLCRDIGVDADALVAGNYQGWMLQFVERQIVEFVPDRERVLRRLAEWGQTPKTIMDAESEYRSYRKLLEGMSSEVVFKEKPDAKR